MKSRAPRRQKFHSRSKPATLARQARMRELLSFASEGMSVREMAHELGISRQLCLYHVKKLAADLGCVLVSAGCSANGQMMWQVWDESWLARYYAARAPRQSYIEELRHVA